MLKSRFLNIQLECGVDEAGCGSAFGPVVAAAVIMPEDWSHPLLNDSKNVSEKNRKILESEIKENAITYAISSVDASEIDKMNILQARLLAMKNSISKLEPKPENILVDGNRFYQDFPISSFCIVKGDSKFISIAAASILAKVHRDELMIKLQEEYSQWNIGKHKGYLTKEHYELINKFGISNQHRKTFLKNYL